MLLDMEMPELDGLGVLEEMSKKSSEAKFPVIVVSGADQIEKTIKCIELGAEDYLPKPFDPVLLKARIFSSLEKKRLKDLEALQLKQLEEEKQLLEMEQMKTLTGGKLYQVVTDATGNQHSMSNALNYVAFTGKLVFVGITTEEVKFRHPLLHRPEASVVASRNALPPDFTRIIDLIEKGVIQTDPWITHRTSFDSVAEDFDQLTKPETGVIKAMIEVA